MAHLEYLDLKVDLGLAREECFQDLRSRIEGGFRCANGHAVIAGLCDHKADVENGPQQVHDIVDILWGGGVVDVESACHHALELAAQRLRVVDE